MGRNALSLRGLGDVSAADWDITTVAKASSTGAKLLILRNDESGSAFSRIDISKGKRHHNDGTMVIGHGRQLRLRRRSIR